VSVEPESKRKPRADSLRNREQLLAAAKAAFTEVGADAPLEAIARRAGVGIGTLYRHFPTRDALLTAVYRREVEQLCGAADTLLATRAAGDALEAWLNLLVDYMVTKRVVAPALRGSPGEGPQVYASSGPAMIDVLNRLVAAGKASGEIRADLTPEDVFRMLIGVSHGYEQPGWEESARRLIGILVSGLKAPR
jgi:AcrR family transcriptional regulator